MCLFVTKEIINLYPPRTDNILCVNVSTYKHAETHETHVKFKLNINLAYFE